MLDWLLSLADHISKTLRCQETGCVNHSICGRPSRGLQPRHGESRWFRCDDDETIEAGGGHLIEYSMVQFLERTDVPVPSFQTKREPSKLRNHLPSFPTPDNISSPARPREISHPNKKPGPGNGENPTVEHMQPSLRLWVPRRQVKYNPVRGHSI